MSPLNIHPEESSASTPKKKKSKTLKVMLGIGALVLVPVIGSTFAATINITNGPEINFGQGQVQAIACDADGVTVTAESIFENVADDEGVYRLGTVAVAGISDDCDEVEFKVSIYDNTAGDPATPLVFCGGVEFDIAMPGDGGGGPCLSGDDDVEYFIDNLEDTLEIRFGTADPEVLSTDVYKITVETS